MIRILAIALLTFAMLHLAENLRGASLSYNQMATEAIPSNNMLADSRLIIFDDSPYIEASDSLQLLQANYADPEGTHDWGGDTEASPHQDDFRATSRSFLTVDADGSASVRVRYTTNALVLAENPSFESRQGDAASGVSYFLAVNMDDLAEGGLYSLDFGWLAQASARLRPVCVSN